MDPIVLARIQFGANISFHILFPTITIALGWVLLFFKLRFNATGNEAWMNAYRFFVKVFALSFALGVVSGITMSFQFGTNWPGFMERVGNIAGPLLAYEVLTAFFLEATFLGIMLFGFRKVPNWVHTTATFLVAFGTTMSAFWILVLNSWMHTPVGFEMRDGVAHAVDWWAILFNPSMPYRLTHMLIASGLTCAFLVAGLSAYRWLRKDRGPDVMAAMRTGIVIAAALIPVQIIVGDMHGLNTLEHQPAKVAAMEGNWETQGHTPLLLFAWPNQAERKNDFEIGIPSGASLILKHDPAGVVPGLNDFVAENGDVLHPPVAPVFFGFRVMVGVGMLMLLVSWFAAFRLWRVGDVSRPLAFALVGMTFSGWVATLAGWYVTEIGRQPWLVTGVLTTAQAASDVSAGMIGSTLAMYLAIYGLLIAAYVSVLFHLAGKGVQGQSGGTAIPSAAPVMFAAKEPDMDFLDAYSLPLIFAALMGIAILAYVILDGYDLGVGMLMIRAERAERDKMVATIGPFWDANETWLVLGIGLLLVAFPAAHGLVLTSLYLPVALMLLGLTLRGVAFEFRVKAQMQYREWWDYAFIGGSALASLTQGYMLGRYVMGFADGWTAEIFALLAAIGLAAAYLFVGATWLVAKTEGALQVRAVRWARITLVLTAVGMLVISLATPWISPRIFERWFAFPNIIGLMPIPLMTGALFASLWVFLRRMPRVDHSLDLVPFMGAISLFALGFLGLAYSFYPYVVPEKLTIWQAASSPDSLLIILFGALAVLPFIIAYTAFSYYVFRGKAAELRYD